ncbi:MAG: hypothetical protein RJA45_774 [Actinomycetota bacterium]
MSKYQKLTMIAKPKNVSGKKIANSMIEQPFFDSAGTLLELSAVMAAIPRPRKINPMFIAPRFPQASEHKVQSGKKAAMMIRPAAT